jgi:hypothetical protein
VEKSNISGFFRDLAKGFEEFNNDFDGISKCKWYKVHVDSINDMNDIYDYNKYNLVYYPMIGYYQYIKKYKHYILGYKYDSKDNIKYIIYGIPGTKRIADQPFGGSSGFVSWVPANKGQEDENDMGYWLMFYDFRTSEIVIPRKK